MKEKKLIKAVNEVLIKSMIQSITTYTISCFKLLIFICEDLHSMMARFWWGFDIGKRAIHWLAWDRVCKSKKAWWFGF